MWNLDGDDNVLRFTQEIPWERYMVAIPSLHYFDPNGSVVHRGIISHGPYTSHKVTQFFWNDLIGFPST
jgi:hypothetical protein